MPAAKRGVRSSSHHSSLEVRKVRGMGRGVFATRTFRPEEVIEACPVILMPGITDENQLGGMKNYVFMWREAENILAIALGYGSLYNHNPNPNAKFDVRYSRNEIVFKALRKIAPGEQILIDYGWDEGDYAAFRKTG